MNITSLSGLIIVAALCGCSSSSSTIEENVADSLESNVTQTLRLRSEQITFGNGSIATNDYRYDELGNLIGVAKGDSIVTYSIDSVGRIMNARFSEDGVIFRDSEIYSYDEEAGLRRIDALGYIQNVGIIGVSAIDVYNFEGNLAMSVEKRTIPFDDISLFNPLDDSAGFIFSNTEFEYEGDRLIRERIDEGGNGTVETQRDYTYNADGTLASILDSGASVISRVFIYEQGICNHNWGNSTHRYYCVAN